MPYYCTVPRCTSMAGKAKNVSFHQFPRDEELAKLWNKILKRGKPYTKYSKVCSLHFKPEDYTITSVGKNKGQWRTLRKDAIPSQNLPSESPTPYHRKQWSTWGPQTPHNVIDPAIQQQVAQAIYMQTMLAMQAAGGADIPPTLHNGTSSIHDHTLPHSSNEQHIKNDPVKTSYKCTECSKCFKDPDVFILHKRIHMKNEKQEKENFNTNTLRSNPILANLLKNQNSENIFDNNVVMENLLMSALAANLDYIRNISMIKNEECDGSPDSLTEDLTSNADGFTNRTDTRQSSDGFTRQSNDGFSNNRTDGQIQNSDGFTPIRISRQNSGEYTSNRTEVRQNSGEFTAQNTDGISPQNSDQFSQQTCDEFSQPNRDEFTKPNRDEFAQQNRDGLTDRTDGFTYSAEQITKNTDGFNPPFKTNDSKCHKNDLEKQLSKKETPNCSFSNENQYRIDLKYADFKVHSDGFTSPDGFISPDGFTSPDGFISPDGFTSPDANSAKFKRNSEIKSVANCDSELNESYESNNLIIDENL